VVVAISATLSVNRSVVGQMRGGSWITACTTHQITLREQDREVSKKVHLLTHDAKPLQREIARGASADSEGFLLDDHRNASLRRESFAVKGC